MSDPQTPPSNYFGGGTQTTSHPSGTRHASPDSESSIAVSQTMSDKTQLLPLEAEPLQMQRYGTGKPRRVRIRGRISHD